MKNVIRNGALALGLIAGVALVAAPPASAGSIQRDGYFGGTWKPIGPRNNRYVKRNRRNYGPDVYAYSGPRTYYGPGYYGPRGYYSSDYYYGPSYYGFGRRGGIGIGIGF